VTTLLDPLHEHPFALPIGLTAIGNGGALAAGLVGPASLNATLPEVLVRCWGGTQFIAGALIVAGIMVRYSPALGLLGLRLERAGSIPLAAALAVYTITVIAYAGTRGLYPASICAAFALAFALRARSIARTEMRIRNIQRDGGGGD
jgi:hypothetical protein